MSDDPAFLFDPLTAAIFPSAPRPLREAPPIYRQTPAPPATQQADLELCASIELGRVRMRLADLLQLSDGAVLELNKSAGEPVDIVVNDQVIARGEVVVVNEKFAVRIVQVMPTANQVQG